MPPRQHSQSQQQGSDGIKKVSLYFDRAMKGEVLGYKKN